MRIVAVALVMLAAITSPANAYCGNHGVFVFSAHWCPACRAAEQFLASYSISYERIEVTNNPRVQQFMREHFGTTAIPIIVVDGSHKLGYDVAWLQTALCVR